MKQTPPTSMTAMPHDSTFGEMLEELVDLSAGLGVALMPLLLLAMPGIILFVILPAILLLALAAPLAVIGAVIGVPAYLLVRIRKRRISARPGRAAPQRAAAPPRAVPEARPAARG